MSAPQPPLALLAELTHRCPLQCPYCSNPLALERPMGRGRVVMLTFGFELDRGNIARTRVFPPARRLIR